MKIITDSAVYVQKNDIAYLNQTDLAIPASIFMKVFGSGIVIIDDSNRYEFVEFDCQWYNDGKYWIFISYWPW